MTAETVLSVLTLVNGNEQSPTVTNRDHGTKRISVSADDLSRRLESAMTTGTVANIIETTEDQRTRMTLYPSIMKFASVR